jgi:hypothetical protein
MFNNNYWMIFKAVLPIAAIVSFANIPNCDFLNTCKLPVVLTVPFYTDGSEEPEACDIVLQHGDFYQSSKIGNGYIYEKYGLMPGIAKETMKTLSEKMPSLYFSPKEELVDYEKIENGLVSEQMPNWWIEKAVRNFEMYHKSYMAAIENLRSEKERLEAIKPDVEDDFAKKDFCESYSNYIYTASQQIRRFSYVTNIVENKLKLLANPEADVDDDGLNNRDELRCGTCPTKPDSVVIIPNKIKITQNGNEIITNVFLVQNLTKTNVCCKLIPYSIDEKFAPTIEGVNIKSVTNVSKGIDFSLDAKSSAQFLLLWRSEKLPYQLPYDYNIDLYTNETYQASLRPFVINNQSVSLESPVIVSPKDGEYLPNLRNIKFVFDSKDEDRSHYQNKKGAADDSLMVKVFIYDIDGKDMRKDIRFSLAASHLCNSDMPSSNKEYFFVKDSVCDFIPSGNYIWRLVKQNAYSNAVTSDWRWFSVGVPIGSEFKKSSNESCDDQNMANTEKKPANGSYYHVNKKSVIHELIVNVPFEYCTKDFYSNFEGKNGPKLDGDVRAAFSENLPVGLSGKRTSGDFIVSGVPQKAGIFTNYFVVYNIDNVVKERHVFKIADIGEPAPPQKTEDKHQISFLATHKPNLVIHKMKVGKKDKYPMGLDWMCVDFEKRKNIKMEKQLEVSFLDQLPAGFELTVETEEIKGKTFVYHMLCDIPEKAGIYTNYARIVNTEFVYTNTHIFNVEKP